MSENNTTAPLVEEIKPRKDFWATNSRKIMFVGIAIIALILGWLGYNHFVKGPKEVKANEAIFPAERFFDKMATTGFSQDSVNTVLNGGESEGTKITGLLKIINSYGGTQAANRANYMVGASYLHIQQYDKAIQYLKAFNANGAAQLESKAYILLGHAYAEQKKNDDALNYYKKASTSNPKDESISADALFIAANYAETIGKTKDAIELFKKLRDNYPTATTVTKGEVDKSLARLGVVE